MIGEQILTVKIEYGKKVVTAFKININQGCY